MSLAIDDVRELLLGLLTIPSYAKEEAAVAAVVAERLRAIGAVVEFDRAGEAIGGDCGNLIARLPGTVDAPALFLNAHLDTVGRTAGLTPQVGADGIVRTQGDTVLGADDKAGVTAILSGVAAAVADGLPRPPLEIVFTVAEEIGLLGARELDVSTLAAPYGFVFDSGTPMGEMVVSAPFHAHLAFTIKGQAAHAGVCPEAGVSAVACAALAIGGLQLGRIDAETTCSVGTIHGGSARNIIPDRCVVEAEARSRDRAKLDRLLAHFQRTFDQAAEAFGASVEAEISVMYDGFRIADDEPTARLARRAVEAAGLTPSFADGGGGSDANIFNARGPRCILMACGEQHPHTPEECVAIADVATAARVVYELIRAGATRA